METGTNGETPATSELDLSIILQGILWLSLSWMISTFSHVLSLLLLWGSEDVVLDELMKRLFCFASRWRCIWMCLRLNEWEGQCDEMKEQARSPVAVVDLLIPGTSCMFCWAQRIVLPVLLLFPLYSWRLTPCLLSPFLHYCPWLLSMNSWYCMLLSVLRSLLSIHPTLLIAFSIRIATPMWYALRHKRVQYSSFLKAWRRVLLVVTTVISVQWTMAVHGCCVDIPSMSWLCISSSSTQCPVVYVMYSLRASCFWSDSGCAVWAMYFHLSSLHLLSGRGYGWSTLYGEVKKGAVVMRTACWVR